MSDIEKEIESATSDNYKGNLNREELGYWYRNTLTYSEVIDYLRPKPADIHGLVSGLSYTNLAHTMVRTIQERAIADILLKRREDATNLN